MKPVNDPALLAQLNGAGAPVQPSFNTGFSVGPRGLSINMTPNTDQNKIQNYTPASEESQKQFMKETSDNFSKLRDAPTLIKNIEEAKFLVPKASGFMGTGGETLLDATKFLNNRLGLSINTEGVKAAEELRSRIFFQIMDSLKKLDASPSQQQQAVMQKALGNLGTDPAAISNVLDAFGEVIRGKVNIHNKIVDDAEQRGIRFPYNPRVEIPELNATVNPVSTAQPAVQSAVKPKLGTEDNGFVFMGGNPADKKNWIRR